MSGHPLSLGTVLQVHSNEPPGNLAILLSYYGPISLSTADWSDSRHLTLTGPIRVSAGGWTARAEVSLFSRRKEGLAKLGVLCQGQERKANAGMSRASPQDFSVPGPS